jgi:hypothetical protein
MHHEGCKIALLAQLLEKSFEELKNLSSRHGFFVQKSEREGLLNFIVCILNTIYCWIYNKRDNFSGNSG